MLLASPSTYVGVCYTFLVRVTLLKRDCQFSWKVGNNVVNENLLLRDHHHQFGWNDIGNWRSTEET